MTNETTNTPWTPNETYKVGDLVQQEWPIEPSWWRRVFLREKPRQELKTFQVLSTGRGGLWQMIN